MAVIFFSNGVEYAIGGQLGRPFPKYSVSAESTSADDGSQLGVRFAIEVTGQIIIDADAEFDDNGELSNKGAKQDRLHEIINELLEKIETEDSYGKLEIDPYNGMPTKLQYDSAKLTSISIPEQSDESRSLSYMEYTFSFEAYSNNVLPQTILSVNETVEVSENSDQFSTDGLWESDIYKTYTITHSLSAVGRKKYTENGIAIDGDAWRQAELFVRGRLIGPTDLVRGSITGGTDVSLDIQKMSGESDGVFDLSTNNYIYYNHLRVPSCDITGGSYSITDTWIGSKHPASTDMEVSSELDESGITTVTLSGSIEGFNEGTAKSNTISKLSNAEVIFDIIDANAYAISNQAYFSNPECGNALQNVITGRSVGKNKNSGIITFSYSYSDKPYPSELIIEGVPITTSLSINTTYENEDEDFKVNTVAILPLIFKPDGPEIQDMGTTPERRRSVQIDAIMGKCFRAVKPTSYFKPIILRYRPGIVSEGHYVESFSESFDDMTGSYTINVTWVF
jgi:hypothetical protein